MEQISFTMTISEQPFVLSFRDGLMKWISHIEKDRESFSVEITQTATKGGQNDIGIVKALMDVLPLREEEKVKEICEGFGIEEQDIVFDTYQKKYVINTHIPELDLQEEGEPTSFYKYISLDVLISMLNNKTFRMNAITAQSDRTESLYLGDFLCDEFEDQIERFKNLHKERHYLISSFTTSYDDAEMWNAYGDNGQGVMLEFSAITEGTSVWKKVQYVNQDSSPLKRYRDGMKKLKQKGIHIHFSSIDNNRRFVKDAQYIKEKEWRLLKDYPGTLNYTMYQEKGTKRFAYYRDFTFEENKIPELQIKLVGIVVGPRLCLGTNDFADIAYAAKKVFNLDMVNCSRCKNET